MIWTPYSKSMWRKDFISLQLYVAADTVPCTGVAPMECLQIRENKDDPWELHYDAIEGFEPEPVSPTAYESRSLMCQTLQPMLQISAGRWIWLLSKRL